MSEAMILAAVRAAIREETGDSQTYIGPTTTAADISGWDSLAHGRIMMAIEGKLNFTVDIDRTYGLQNVGELLRLVYEAKHRDAER
jgi:acyl carrier protein